MKIGVLQSRLPIGYDTRNPGDFDFEKCRRLSAEFMDREFVKLENALADGVKLIVTVEGFNVSVNCDDTRYDFAQAAEPLDGPLMKRFCALSGKYGAYIVAGLYTRQNGRVYNSAVLFGPEGTIEGIHNKVHLPAGEEIGVTPGDRFRVFDTPYGKIGMLVCWDLQYPEAARELALQGADLICCPTWGCEMKYVPCRAYENSVTLAVAMGLPAGAPLWAGCDPSCVVDNMGDVAALAGREQEGVVTAEIDVRREPAPQYGSERYTGHTSMRQTRLSQRRPDTYREIVKERPALADRYDGYK